MRPEHEAILEAYRYAQFGTWFPVLNSALELLLHTILQSAQNEPIPEPVATVDLMLQLSRGRAPTFRAAAERWNWKEHQARSLYERIGLLRPRHQTGHKPDTTGTQAGHNRDTENNDSSRKTTGSDTTGTQQGHKPDTAGTHDYYIELRREKSERGTRHGKSSQIPKPSPKTSTPGDEARLAAELAALTRPTTNDESV